MGSEGDFTDSFGACARGCVGAPAPRRRKEMLLKFKLKLLCIYGFMSFLDGQ